MNSDDVQNSADELVEVIDADDTVERIVTRAEMRAGRFRHRCTFIAVHNSAGDLLIHRRSDAKDLWPGRWDLACGGVVTAGEEWEPAARRELAEELGIEGAVLTYLGESSYADAHVDELARIWRTTWDGPVTFADGEVVEALFVTDEQLRTRLERYMFVPDSVALVLPMLSD